MNIRQNPVTFFSILGLEKDTLTDLTLKDLQHARKNFMRKNHPDKRGNEGKLDCQYANMAFDILKEAMEKKNKNPKKFNNSITKKIHHLIDNQHKDTLIYLHTFKKEMDEKSIRTFLEKNIETLLQAELTVYNVAEVKFYLSTLEVIHPTNKIINHALKNMLANHQFARMKSLINHFHSFIKGKKLNRLRNDITDSIQKFTDREQFKDAIDYLKTFDEKLIEPIKDQISNCFKNKILSDLNKNEIVKADKHYKLVNKLFDKKQKKELNEIRHQKVWQKIKAYLKNGDYTKAQSYAKTVSVNKKDVEIHFKKHLNYFITQLINNAQFDKASYYIAQFDNWYNKIDLIDQLQAMPDLYKKNPGQTSFLDYLISPNGNVVGKRKALTTLVEAGIPPIKKLYEQNLREDLLPILTPAFLKFEMQQKLTQYIHTHFQKTVTIFNLPSVRAMKGRLAHMIMTTLDPRHAVRESAIETILSLPDTKKCLLFRNTLGDILTDEKYINTWPEQIRKLIFNFSTPAKNLSPVINLRYLK